MQLEGLLAIQHAKDLVGVKAVAEGLAQETQPDGGDAGRVEGLVLWCVRQA